MRNAFIEHLTAHMAQDESIFLVVGDLGYSVVEPLVERYPERFLNAGVAEQNMTAVACGLAREGYKVFTYSIANFTTLRCLEQIRNGVCYHGLPVCVVSVGGGYMYGYLGPTHHATEDIGIMRTLPGMRVFVPFSQRSAQLALDEVLQQPGPAYIRLGRQGKAVDDVAHNGLTLVRAGAAGSTERAVIAVGKICDRVVRFAEERTADLYALCRVNPLPEPDLAKLFEQYAEVTVIEDHQRNGGVMSALAEFSTGIKGVNIAGRFSLAIEHEDGQRAALLFGDQSRNVIHE
ncbi:MAG: transketolase [Pseudomonadota bacterium]